MSMTMIFDGISMTICRLNTFRVFRTYLVLVHDLARDRRTNLESSAGEPHLVVEKNAKK